MVSQPHWWGRCRCCRRRRRGSHLEDYGEFDLGSAPGTPPSSGFLTDRDHLIMRRFTAYQNQPQQLLKLAMPAYLSLIFCPLTLLMYGPLVRFFWPVSLYPNGPPNVNDVISCFLTPAGLVYAIAFGFAFQEALGKQDGLTNRFALQLNKMEQIKVMTRHISRIVDADRALVLTILKNETVKWMELLMIHGKSAKNPQMSDKHGKYLKALNLCNKL